MMITRSDFRSLEGMNYLNDKIIDLKETAKTRIIQQIEGNREVVKTDRKS